MKFFHIVISVIILFSSVEINSLSQGLDLQTLVELEPSVEYDRKETLESGKANVTVLWHVNLETKNITFTVIADTDAWVGFGFTHESSSMRRADMIIGGVYDDGTEYFEDRYGDHETGEPGIGSDDEDDKCKPSSGREPDWHLIEASETSGSNETNRPSTTLKFWRKFDTEDPCDLKITDETVYVLWAIGDSDLGENITHVDLRGSKWLIFLSEESSEEASTTLPSTTLSKDDNDNVSESTTSGSRSENGKNCLLYVLISVTSIIANLVLTSHSKAI